MYSLTQSIEKMFNPANNPMLGSLSQKFRPVHIPDEAYAEIDKMIGRETEGEEYASFQVAYDFGEYQLTVRGEEEREYYDSIGDGISTPQETIEGETQRKITYYDCRDENGNLVKTDFDPSKL